MATLTNPSEIARETLKQLMSRRMAPSPDNYRAIYNEIAGVSDKSSGSSEAELKSLLLSLPKETPAQQRLARQLDQSLKASNLDEYRSTLVEFIKEHSAESNHDLMITNQLHDLHATGADRSSEGRIIAEAGISRIQRIHST